MQVLVSGLLLGWFGFELLRGERAAKAMFVAVALIAAIVVASAAFVSAVNLGLEVGGHSSVGWQQISGQNQLKKFSSYEELENFVVSNFEIVDHYDDIFYRGPVSVAVPRSLDGAEGIRKGEGFSADFSTTNIQVGGVDEADIVKSDGKYIYVVSGNRVIIIDVYPAESAKILSEIEENGNPTEIFINGDKLVVFGRTFVRVYDVSCKEEPILKRDVSFDGNYLNSRMIGGYVYVIVISPPIYYSYTWEGSEEPYVGMRDGIPEAESEITLPEISPDGNVRTIQANEIYYFNIPDYSYEFTTIMVINIQDDDEEITTETILMGSANNIFVS
ncbi:MAG: beta-propeller domain-containing protein, partial [Candidatus Hadarchaeota archaeon]|nr:beta-propeller domain-containing protein [Candidatus Hadarchaeota archaeon]